MKPPKKSPKKSETLEIRLSHPDKQALQAKAAAEGRTVSDVMRGLISTYLNPSDARASSQTLTERVMTVLKKPKILAVTALSALALPFAYAPFAAAADISLAVQGEYTVPVEENGEMGTRLRRFTNEYHFDEADQISYPVMGPNGDPALVLTLTLKQIGEDVAITLSFADAGKVVADPTLMARFGETASFITESPDGTRFSFSVTPEKL